MKAALYLRVSTTDQDTSMQRRDLMEMAQRRNFEVVDIYEDDGVSGAKTRRPELDRLLKDAKRGRFKVVAIWKLDRLGRSTPHLISLLETFQSYGIDLISLSEGLDFSTPSGRLMYTVIAAFAQFERDGIRERVRAGISNARAKGVRLGRPSNSVTAEQIAAKLSEGKNHAAVAAELGISRSSVFGILQRNRTAAM